jgi:hypothetical protein
LSTTGTWVATSVIGVASQYQPKHGRDRQYPFSVVVTAMPPPASDRSGLL